MTPWERCQKILEVLCLRRHDTYSNLAYEFNVSVGTPNSRWDRPARTKFSPISANSACRPSASLTTHSISLESLLKEFKAHTQRFISGMTAFDRQADTFARMSYVQSNGLRYGAGGYGQ